MEAVRRREVKVPFSYKSPQCTWDLEPPREQLQANSGLFFWLEVGTVVFSIFDPVWKSDLDLWILSSNPNIKHNFIMSWWSCEDRAENVVTLPVKNRTPVLTIPSLLQQQQQRQQHQHTHTHTCPHWHAGYVHPLGPGGWGWGWGLQTRCAA